MMPFVNLTAQREAYREELETAERAVLDSGCYIGGPEVAALEKELADYCNSGNSDAGSDGAKPGKQGFFGGKEKHFTGKDHAEPETRAIACASGTDALTIALMALGIKPGDEVIVPDFTFIAPAECVAFLGGTPRFADIDPETLLIDPESVKALIGPKTRGIIAVDLFGQVADFNELWEIAVANDLWLLEDAAQAFGATFAPWEGISPNKPWRAGTIGSISITSFYPSKPLGCYGDGGALFTSDPKLEAKIRQIANHGSRERYLHETVGMNSRLDALQAAILRVKLRHLEEELKVRRENARKYGEFFAEYNAGLRASGDIDGAKVVPQKIEYGCTSTYAQYTVLADDRKAFIKKLDKAGIPHCIHYPMPLHKQPCFRGLAQGSENRNAIMASQKAVSLPVCAFTDVDFIINKLRSVL
ncbi:UDP-2-acetamido-2-deoxy-ribo-hexuluronate aminotransferase [Fibrobacter sp. UWR3]|uniref:DegT/DnrJ/EryC1/StrS family aminotransferase n=1 Tax=Fibrobacter sp. UWR3 TaxID=1896217 RepID=UPI00090F855A|nr:DegT/DnrJ/EryC1/StrS family aminotransferase [Fibrobacter sp. UWR3]SHM34222.1 UDP-2-acetamido-2-deoxy-ribo-hexuluronate aminotransferase [Fibrobacter sp. UWR3]